MWQPRIEAGNYTSLTIATIRPMYGTEQSENLVSCVLIYGVNSSFPIVFRPSKSY